MVDMGVEWAAQSCWLSRNINHAINFWITTKPLRQAGDNDPITGKLSVCNALGEII